MHASSKRRSVLWRILGRSQKTQAADQENEMHREDTEERKPHNYSTLPPTRPRALTMGSHDAVSKQSQSPLLRLPPEIRQLIWRQVIGGHTLHIARAQDRLVGISCTQSYGAERNTRNHSCWDGTFDRDLWEPILHTGHVTPLGILAPLQTCRLVYSEAVSILYGDNIFDINHPDTLVWLEKTVLPQRLAEVRSLNLTWDHLKHNSHVAAPFDLTTWRQACTVLETRFTGLRELTVHLVNRCSDDPLGDGHQLRCIAELEPLRGVKADRFDVYFYYWEDACAAAAKSEGFPFKLLPDEDTPVADGAANPYSYAFRQSLKDRHGN